MKSLTISQRVQIAKGFADVNRTGTDTQVTTGVTLLMKELGGNGLISDAIIRAHRASRAVDTVLNQKRAVDLGDCVNPNRVSALNGGC